MAAHRGLGATRDREVTEVYEEHDWHRVNSWRPRRAPPSFVPALLPQPSIETPEESTTEEDEARPMVRPPPPPPKQPTTGEEARRLYLEALSSRARVQPAPTAIASTSGTSIEEAIDLDSPPATPLPVVDASSAPTPPNGAIPVAGKATVRCEACETDVLEADWQRHTLSLPHLIASETSPTLILPPHIALHATNPGRRMLEANGWTQGEGLGLMGTGRAVPLRPVEKHDRLGIGLKLAGDGKERKRKLAIITEGKAARRKRQAREAMAWRQMYGYIRGNE